MNGKASWVRVSWMAAALLPFLAGFAGAVNPILAQANQPIQQDEQMAPSPSPGQTAPAQLKLEKAKDLLGAKIINDRGEELGTVADIVLTPGRDAVNYVVLSHGGTWGMASKYFAVPWSQFGLRAGAAGEKPSLVLSNVSKADLDQAQGFDKDHWPTTASADWLGIQRSPSMAPAPGTAPSGTPPVRLLANQENNNTNENNNGVTDENGDQGLFTAPESGEYATPDGVLTREPPTPGANEPATEPGRGSSANTGGEADIQSPMLVAATDSAAINPPAGIDQLRLSKLLGTMIRNDQGRDLGKLSDAMIDVSRGKLAFGVVSLHSGFLGLNKDYAAVPWTALDLSSQPGIAKLNADKQTLMASAFSRDSFPDLSNPQYSRDLYDRFHATPYWEEGQNLGYIPGQENQTVNPPMAPIPPSGMTAPNTGANTAAPELIAHTEKYPMAYNPDTVQTIRGRITSVGTHKIPDTTTQGVYLHVKTDAGRTMRVYVGPRPFIDSRGFSFHKGDVVTITGSLVRHGQHEAVLASQIRRANQTLDLRTPEGRPLWSMERSRGPNAYSYGYGSPSRY
jgi:sporulation protein YlmC with PRC-barrel domain